MTKDEILVLLEDKGIILTIGEEFYLTEKYKDVLVDPKLIDKTVKAIKTLEVVNEDVITAYDESISKQKGRLRAAALMSFCKVPTWKEGPSGERYRVKSLDKDSITIINNVVENPDEFDPTAVIQVIKDYYSKTSTPRAFKNFVKDDLFDLYQEHLNGNAIPDKSSPKDNATWD